MYMMKHEILVLSEKLDELVMNGNSLAEVLAFCKEHDAEILDVLEHSDTAPRVFSLECFARCSFDDQLMVCDLIKRGRVPDELSSNLAWQVLQSNMDRYSKSLFQGLMNECRFDRRVHGHPYTWRCKKHVADFDLCFRKTNWTVAKAIDLLNNSDDREYEDFVENLEHSLWCNRILQADIFKALSRNRSGRMLLKINEMGDQATKFYHQIFSPNFPLAKRLNWMDSEMFGRIVKEGRSPRWIAGFFRIEVYDALAADKKAMFLLNSEAFIKDHRELFEKIFQDEDALASCLNSIDLDLFERIIRHNLTDVWEGLFYRIGLFKRLTASRQEVILANLKGCSSGLWSFYLQVFQAGLDERIQFAALESFEEHKGLPPLHNSKEFGLPEDALRVMDDSDTYPEFEIKSQLCNLDCHSTAMLMNLLHEGRLSMLLDMYSHDAEIVERNLGLATVLRSFLEIRNGLDAA